MSVVINYKFGAECSEKELVARLGRLRAAALRIDGVSAGPIKRVEPCYSRLLFRALEASGIRLPPAVVQRIKQAREKDDRFRAELWLGLSALDPQERLRFSQTAATFMESTKLWKASDYPAQFSIGSSLTYSRSGILLEFANAILLRGYVLVMRVAEGCEPLTIPLASYRSDGTALWCGGGFTRTQYSLDFKRAHENVCHILDSAGKEGLLVSATDTCDFYRHRNWRRSAPMVNRETDFIAAVSAAFTGKQ